MLQELDFCDTLLYSTFYKFYADWDMTRKRWNSFVVNWQSDIGYREHRKGDPIQIDFVMGCVFLVCALPTHVWDDLPWSLRSHIDVLHSCYIYRKTNVPGPIYERAVSCLLSIVTYRTINL